MVDLLVIVTHMPEFIEFWKACPGCYLTVAAILFIFHIEMHVLCYQDVNKAITSAISAFAAVSLALTGACPTEIGHSELVSESWAPAQC